MKKTVSLDDLHSKSAFIIDMDGVIYHGNRLLPNVPDFVNWLTENEKEFLFLLSFDERSLVLQMTFEKYLIAKPLFKSEEHEKAWLLRVAINISKNLVTCGWKKKVIYDDEQLKLFADEAVAQEGISDSDDNSEAVLKAVLALPKNLSVVIQLFYY